MVGMPETIWAWPANAEMDRGDWLSTKVMSGCVPYHHDSTVSTLRAELEGLKHDIARHVAIASEEATRAEEAQRELLAERMFRATAVARLVGYVQGISGDGPVSDPMEFIERMRAGLKKEVAAFDEAARALARAGERPAGRE